MVNQIKLMKDLFLTDDLKYYDIPYFKLTSYGNTLFCTKENESIDVKQMDSVDRFIFPMSFEKEGINPDLTEAVCRKIIFEAIRDNEEIIDSMKKLKNKIDTSKICQKFSGDLLGLSESYFVTVKQEDFGCFFTRSSSSIPKEWGCFLSDKNKIFRVSSQLFNEI